jgi:hypothetical protein
MPSDAVIIPFAEMFARRTIHETPRNGNASMSNAAQMNIVRNKVPFATENAFVQCHIIYVSNWWAEFLPANVIRSLENTVTQRNRGQRHTSCQYYPPCKG